MFRHRIIWPGRIDKELWVVLATVLDRHFESRYGSEPNRSKIGSPGCQQTQTVNSGTVQSTSPYQSESGGFSAGCTAGPSVTTYTMLSFAM